MRVFRIVGMVSIFVFVLVVLGPLLDKGQHAIGTHAADDPSAHQLTHNLTVAMEKGVKPASKRVGKPDCPRPRYHPIPQAIETPDALRFSCGYYGQRSNPWSIR